MKIPVAVEKLFPGPFREGFGSQVVDSAFDEHHKIAAITVLVPFSTATPDFDSHQGHSLDRDEERAIISLVTRSDHGKSNV